MTDFGRWAVVAPNNDSGLGRMAQDLKSILPLDKHLVTNSSDLHSSGLPDRSLRLAYEEPLDPQCSIAELKKCLRGLDGIIFFERYNWHPFLLKAARFLQIRSVCVPMWEWFNGSSPEWQYCDFFACPNRICLRTVRSYGYQNSALIPWALNLSRLPIRTVCGPAKSFIHNAGIIDPDDRKGTKDTIKAFSLIGDPCLSLSVRLQVQENLQVNDSRVDVSVGNLSDPADLYRKGDACIQPSKLEGIGFMVLEAIASGLPVITLDIEPLNEWGNQHQLQIQPGFLSWPAYSSAWIEQSHIRKFSLRRLAEKIRWAASNDLSNISLANRTWAEQNYNSPRLQTLWIHLLRHVLSLQTNYAIHPLYKVERLPCHKLSYKLRSRLQNVLGFTLPVLPPRP